MALANLPFELVVMVLEDLPIEYLAPIGSTCRYLAEIVLYLYDSESFWRSKCQRKGYDMLPCQAVEDWKTAFVENLEIDTSPKITKTYAKKLYRLTDMELEHVNYEERRNPHYRSATPMRLYFKRELLLVYGDIIRDRLQKYRLKRDKLNRKKQERQRDLKESQFSDSDLQWIQENLFLNMSMLSRSWTSVLKMYDQRLSRYKSLRKQLKKLNFWRYVDNFPSHFRGMLEAYICVHGNMCDIVTACHRMNRTS